MRTEMSQLVLRDPTVTMPADAGETAAGTAHSRASAHRHPIAFELITNLKGLEAIERDWNDLYAAVARPEQVFQSFNWCWHWCRHYALADQKATGIAVVAGRIEGRLALLMPLAVECVAGIKELRWLGEPVSQYGDVVAHPVAAHPADLEAAFRFAATETGADVANLRRVRADAIANRLLKRLGARITATEEAPYLDLSASDGFAAWEARRKPRAAKNRRRQARRLAEAGEVTFVSHSGSPEARDLAALSVRLKRQTLTAKGAIAPSLADERFEAFFADAAEGLGRPTGIRVTAICSNGAPAAIKVLVENDAASFLHIAVFEPGFEKCAPGALLLERVVADTIAEGRPTLDLLPPRHEYKMDFADGTVAVSDHAIALSAKGWLYANAYLRLRRRLKAAVEGLPAPLRKALAKVAS
ncbi:MAG: GNAT family N-acetyltransferase [Proteobacteria bacterium]|nr:GNAT family N-acetyltransferase [Pseudomonadota bacterium]